VRHVVPEQVLLRRAHNDALLKVRDHPQHVCRDDGDPPEQAEALLPELPVLLILHLLQKELPERIDRRLAGKAIINVPVILVRFEPELIGVPEEEQTEK
jgi:hypothetical protein